MKSIKFANGKEYEIIECYNNGKQYINGETRTCREIVLADNVISLNELKALLSDPANLSVIEIYMNVKIDGEQIEDTEVLKNFVYADEIKDKMNGEIWFTIGEKTAMEIKNEQAVRAIDELLIAMEV